MLHTFLGTDVDEVRSRVRAPFRAYLRSAIRLEQLAAEGGGTISGGHRIAPHEIPPAALEELLDLAFERYCREGALFGTPASCEPLVRQLEEIGVDEIACLIDFLDDAEAILASLDHLDVLRAACAPESRAADAGLIPAFLEDLE
jgi:alkanesulfonate monooxygenase SsuD/methylene tetrahydromethanopterin reductase-like flavin-dependent oxidoreductase (luciferase family)